MRGKSYSKETPVSVDGRLLRPVRRMARHHADRPIRTGEVSLRGFWDQWDTEISMLQFKIDPLVKKVFDYANAPMPTIGEQPPTDPS